MTYAVNNLLLQSKFRPQVGVRKQVQRARLALPEAVLQGAVRAVTVVAPMGYGKSTLMAQWYDKLRKASRPGVAAAWLNLDENDNNPARLLRYLYGALGQCIPSLSGHGESDFSQSTNLPAMLEDLSLRIAAHGERVLLFIDDAHLITNEDAAGVFEWLLRYGDAKIGLIVGSQQSLRWRLSEMRLRGQLLELDQQSLAFDSEEAKHFCLSRLAQAIGAPALASLLSRTEGWPAAMELLTLALNDAPDAAKLMADLAATDRGILEYLSDAVFGRLPADLRLLVHQLAQCGRFCAALASTALATPSSDMLFAELQRRNLFLIPLDAGGRWFRFHHLVGDYLRRHDPRPRQEIRQSLVAAGQWFAAHDIVDDAIDCAVRAEEWDLACRWLAVAAEDSAQRMGLGADLLRWFPAIPPEFLERYPQIRLSYLFSLAFKQDHERFEREAETLDQQLAGKAGQPDADPAQLDELRSGSSLQHMLQLALRDEGLSLRAEAEAWIGKWPNARARYMGDALNLAAFACKSTGEIEAGLSFCDRGEAIQASDNGHFGVSWSQLLRTVLLLKRGDYRGALATTERGMAYVRDKLRGNPEHLAYFHEVRAAVFYEFDEVEQAAAAQEGSFGALDETGVADFVLLSYLTRARLQFRMAQAEAGLQALRLGRKLGQRRGLPRVSISLAAEECIWLCRLGQPEAARELARVMDFDRSVHAQYDMVADRAARVAPRLLLSEHPEIAVAQVGPALLRATERGFHHRRVELLILQAMALLRCGRYGEAISSWLSALTAAEHFGYRRVFLDDADFVTALSAAARSHRGVAPAPWLAGGRPKKAGRPEEELTRKEVRILKLLESEASNREIADSLFVSEGTIKWHLHNIYRKLGCKNRPGAIVIAHRLGLL